jgi:hypothetical protein
MAETDYTAFCFCVSLWKKMILWVSFRIESLEIFIVFLIMELSIFMVSKLQILGNRKGQSPTRLVGNISQSRW